MCPVSSVCLFTSGKVGTVVFFFFFLPESRVRRSGHVMSCHDKQEDKARWLRTQTLELDCQFEFEFLLSQLVTDHGKGSVF